MKIFNKGYGWEERVSFVDSNNALVGFDVAQDGGEHADWFIADKITTDCLSNGNQPDELVGYNFDTSYFKEVNYIGKYGEHNSLNGCEMDIFRLVKGKKEKFLHIFNCHTECYTHGFEVKHNKQEIKSGVI